MLTPRISASSVPTDERDRASVRHRGPIRKAFVMSANAGQEAEYERRHRRIWPELEAILKQHGVRTYSIFLLPETRQLFAYVEYDCEEQWNAVAETSICQKWWSYMKDIMPSNPDNSPVSSQLKEVFHLDDKGQCQDLADGSHGTAR